MSVVVSLRTNQRVSLPLAPCPLPLAVTVGQHLSSAQPVVAGDGQPEAKVSMAMVSQRNGLPMALGFPYFPQALSSRTLGEEVSRADESRISQRDSWGRVRLVLAG